MSVEVVAELSSNHAGSLAKAHALVDMAADAGANAIKLQTFEPDALAILRGGGQAPAPWSHLTREELYRQAHTPWEWHAELFSHAKDRGLDAWSSTFSVEATEFLRSFRVKRYKIAAPEWALWLAGERFGLGGGDGVICSVWPEYVFPPRRWGLPSAWRLHCPHGYPASPTTLRVSLASLRAWSWHVGLSDHSLDAEHILAAVALGAEMIEVHVMLDEVAYSVLPLDAAFSWRPQRFADLVRRIRHTEAML